MEEPEEVSRVCSCLSAVLSCQLSAAISLHSYQFKLDERPYKRWTGGVSDNLIESDRFSFNSWQQTVLLAIRNELCHHRPLPKFEADLFELKFDLFELQL